MFRLPVLITLFLLIQLTVTANNISKKQAGTPSSDNIWSQIDDAGLRQRTQQRLVVPNYYKTFRLNKTNLISTLNEAPMEFTSAARNINVALTIPMPDGTYASFKIEESPIMAPELAAKYPEIKTYRGQGIDDPTVTARLDLTPSGFHAIVFAARETIYVDPYAKGDTLNYISYNKSDVSKDAAFECHWREENENLQTPNVMSALFGINVASGTTLRTYRLALAATAEYTNVFRQVGDTDDQAKARTLAAMNTTMNRVNGIYERDLSMRMILVANTNLLLYTDPATDPYTNNSGGAMLGQNQANLDAVIGTANYDIGHVFSTGGGGVASLNVPCNANLKARGVTGLPNPTGDLFAVDYVAHEMGHQFGGRHTFNGSTGNCAGGNRSAVAAYEPGSGSTVMAYAGICGAQNLQLTSNDYFHVKSLEEIVNFVTNAGTCSVNTPTGNTLPTVIIGATSYNIPKQTPFTLTATGADANGDSLTYNWEEYDLGPSAPPDSDADGQARPIFRSYNSTTNPSRTFPSLQYILNNANIPPATTPQGRLTGEILPSINRTMNFQVTVRDNRAGGGGINTAAVSVSVSANSGPFVVTQPNANVSWAASSTQNVTWNVNSTNAAPVNAANVRILLSTDGGNTFSTVILNSTPNDGSENIIVPNVSVTTTARIKIEAVGNIFFDVSDSNFSITGAVARPKRFDFDGDGKTDISVFRPSTGTWFLQRSAAGFTSVNFGLSTDIIAPADYDGDGKTDVAVFRPSNGTWFIIQSSTQALVIQQFGLNNDVPNPADYDGDGKADLAVFRPSTGTWFLQRSSQGFAATQFGISEDKPVVADYDGDGKDDIAVWRPSQGIWYLLNSTTGFSAVQFGSINDKPVPSDYDGDGKADVAVWRPSSGTWFFLLSQSGFSATAFGTANDQPVLGDYDGDGKYDIGVWRSTDTFWYILQSTAGLRIEQFGLSDDKPVPSAYVP